MKNNENPEAMKRYSNLQLTAPDQLIDLSPDSGHVLQIGEFNFELCYPGETHTSDNSVVYIKEVDLLFGGCMIRALTDQRPGYIKYANMQEWPLSVELVKSCFPKSKTVVPSHGLKGGFSLIRHTIDVLNEWNELY